MPPQRTPFGSIDPNRVRGPDLSLYKRGRIAGLTIAGLSQRQIKDTMKHSRKAVRGAIALDILNTNRASLPHLGRLKAYNNWDH
jgi:DNA-binding CsgD family transcriptional regulator